MTAFEVVFSLLTMITSLALAHLLNGLVIVLRNASRVRFSVLHGLWTWIAFSGLIGNWASFWTMHAIDSWPSSTVMLILAAGTLEYAFCALVTPRIPSEGELDLNDFHTSTHRLYILAFITLLVISLALNFVMGGMEMYEHWLHDSVLSFLALVLSILAFFYSTRWIQLGVAVLNAVIVTYYLVVTSNLVAA